MRVVEIFDLMMKGLIPRYERRVGQGSGVQSLERIAGHCVGVWTLRDPINTS